MTHSEGELRSDLERGLAMQNSRNDAGEFTRRRLSSPVFILIEDSGNGIANLDAAPKAQALSFAAKDCTNGRARFSYPERAAVLDACPGIQGESLKDLSRVLMPIVGGNRMVTNHDSKPGLELGFDTVPAQAADTQQTN